MGWSRVFRPAGYGWELRLAALLGCILLVCVLPVVNGVTNNALMGLLFVAIFIWVYGFVAGRLLAIADRRRKLRAQPLE